MNCEEFRPLAQSIARDEPLDAATLEGALNHVDSCVSCDALLEEAEALTSELRALAAHYASEVTPPHVEAQLAAIVAQRNEPQASKSRVWSWLLATAIGGVAEIGLVLRRQSTAILGAAAAIVLVLALTGKPAALWHPAWVTTLAHDNQSRGGTETSAGALPDSQSVDTDADLSADSFVPLSGTYDLASLNDDPIVRVVLSDDDLESLGLPVGDTSDEQVVADLILANDGTPQAIRVVSW